MTDLKKFAKLLKANNFTSSWDSELSVDDAEVYYEDQGGSFSLTELADGRLNFTAHSNDEVEDGDCDINFDTYEDFLDYFTSMYYVEN